MLRHLVIGAVEIRLIAAGAGHPGPWIIRHQQPCDALKKLKAAHMAVNPAGEILAERCSRECVGTRPEHSNEDGGRRGLSGGAIVDRHGIASPVDEHLFSSLVIVAEHDIAIPTPSLIQLAKAAIAVALRMSFAILLPQQLQREMFVSLKLGLQRREIQTRPRLRRRAQWPGRKQKLIEPLVIPIVR
jgi:hypothetical protein